MLRCASVLGLCLGASAAQELGSLRDFVAGHCVRCHGAKRPKGDLSLDRIATQPFATNADSWDRVLQALATRQMPPEKAKRQPSRAQRAQVLAAIRREFRAIGRVPEWDVKARSPEYGNFVEHERLFDPRANVAAFSPSRLWKRSPFQFDDQLLRGLGLGKGRRGRVSHRLAKVKQPFAIEDKSGIRDFAAIQRADSATLATVLRNAKVIVDQHLEEMHVRIHGRVPDDRLPKDRRGRPIRRRPRKTLKPFRDIVLAEDAPTRAQMHAAIDKMFELVVDAAPSAAERESFERLMRRGIARAGNFEGLRMALIGIAISPRAIYRMELGQGEIDEHGRQLLSAANLAFAVSYALTDRRPDPALFAAATKGRLRSRSDVRREVERIWDDREIAKPRILRFFREFFGYHAAPKVFKDDARYGKQYGRPKVAEKLVKDADALVLHIVGQDRDVLARLLTTEEYFVAHSGDNAVEAQKVDDLRRFYEYFKDLEWRKFPYQTPKEHAQKARSISRMFAHPNGNVVKRWMRYLTKCAKNGVTPIPEMRGREYLIAYGLDEKSFDYPTEQPFVLAKGKRVGLLMHPAWLIAHSLNLDNDPIRRGKWIRERLLAGTVPELPITVDARIPEAPTQSLRERFAVTRERACWRCHVQMNPLGMPFELFDDFGRHRTVERLHAKRKTKPVDASGFLQGSGDPKLDGPVDHPIDMMRRLAKSTRVRQSFVRHVFRFFLGRNETYSDAATLVAADRAYVEGGGSFRALVLSLLSSDSFLYRKR